jgi:hypothetical protein
MDYFRDLLLSLFVFFIGYLIFKYDIFKKMRNSRTLEKDYKSCYILKYPNRVEFHNKGEMFLIDFDEFFELNPKLKGKIKIIERPLLDLTNKDAIRNEVEIRREIRMENDDY